MYDPGQLMDSFPDVQFRTGDEADSLMCRIIRSSADQPLTYTSAWPGNCIFGWLSKSCTSACQGLNIGLSEELWIGILEGILAPLQLDQETSYLAGCQRVVHQLVRG